MILKAKHNELDRVTIEYCEIILQELEVKFNIILSQYREELENDLFDDDSLHDYLIPTITKSKSVCGLQRQYYGWGSIHRSAYAIANNTSYFSDYIRKSGKNSGYLVNDVRGYATAEGIKLFKKTEPKLQELRIQMKAAFNLLKSTKDANRKLIDSMLGHELRSSFKSSEEAFSSSIADPINASLSSPID